MIHFSPDLVAASVTFHAAQNPNDIAVVLHRHLHPFTKGAVATGCTSHDCVMAVMIAPREALKRILDSGALQS